MLIWCCTCLSYIGEKPPYQDYRFSHTYCKTCLPNARKIGKDSKKLERIKEALDHFMHRVTSYEQLDARKVVADCDNLGINKISCFYGVISPLLAHIGRLTTEGKVRITDEHLFTAEAETVLHELARDVPAFDASKPADIIFLCSPKNQHSIGVKLMAIHLREHGVNAKAIYPGLPVGEHDYVIKKWQPKTIGISFATSEQFAEGSKFLPSLKSQYDVGILVGGFPISTGEKKHHDYIDYFFESSDINGILNFLRPQSTSRKSG